MFPDDVDGDVLRALHVKKFDFGSEHLVDFYVEFDEHPQAASAEDSVRAEFPTARLDWEDGRCLVVSVVMKVTYHGVVDTQSALSQAVANLGGWCDAWGVMSS